MLAATSQRLTLSRTESTIRRAPPQGALPTCTSPLQDFAVSVLAPFRFDLLRPFKNRCHPRHSRTDRERAGCRSAEPRAERSAAALVRAFRSCSSAL